MTLRLEHLPPRDAVLFLRHCYSFVNEGWQHAVREALPDQGFETRFREACTLKLSGWVVSQPREMGLGCGLSTASGVLHEVDIVVQHDPVMGMLELKNRPGFPPDKNDVIVFFAKMLDYLSLTPTLLRRDLVPIFMSSFAFDSSGLSACLGLGIHPVAPYLRPLPLLIDNARRMLFEIESGLMLGQSDQEAFDDFCSTLNRLSVTLAETAFNRRFDYLTDTSLAVNTPGELPTRTLGDDLRVLNAECTRLIEVFKAATASRSAN